ncbi:MAG: hypothetical protein R3C39_08645 [Dehalococcoidia bacterium]
MASRPRAGNREQAMVDFTVRRVPDFRLLARTCEPQPDLVEPLLTALASDIERGLVRSARSGIAGVAAFLAVEAPPRFAAGVPLAAGEASIGTPDPDYEEVAVQGGRYAMVTIEGEFERIPSIFGEIFEALAGGEETATGETITIYREPGADGRTLTDLGARLAS